MSAARLLLLALVAFASPSLALAQGLAWEYAEPAPQSPGARATLFGFPFPQPNEQPGFSPSAVVAREDGAYLILPVNGGGGSSELGFVLNPSWQRLRGFQILRLDASGQVLWKRFWNLGSATENLSLAPPLVLSDARLTPAGGLSVLAGTRALFLSADGEGESLDPSLPPAACYPSELVAGIAWAQLGADGEFVVAFRDTSGAATRACAFGVDAQLLETVDAPPGEFLQFSDYRRGVGFLLITTASSQLPPPVQTTRLVRDGVQRWQRPGAFISANRLWLSPTGDTWLPDDSQTLRVIRPDGSVRAEIPQIGELSVRAWLADGDALLGNSGVGDVRRISADGLERWRLTRAATSFDLGAWQVLGDRVRLLAAQNSGDGEVLTLDPVAGTLQVGASFTLGGLAAGPLGLSRHLSASSGEPESIWQRDPSTCLNAACAPRGVSFSSTVNLRLFDSTDGTPLAGPMPNGFGFPTYAHLRERAPAVAREVNTLEGAHARYVSTGEKEVLEVTRLSERGQLLWRRQLQVPRFDIADAQVEVVGGIVYVAASSRGPLANQHRLWALDAQGQTLWERELDEPFKQLARVALSADSYGVCGPGFVQRDGSPWQAPRWRCYDAAGSVQFDTRLSQVPVGGDALISHVQGARVFLRLLDAANQSATGVRLRPIWVDGQTEPGAVTWPLDLQGSAEFVRIDAISRRAINLVTAPVYASASAFRPDGLLVAAFDTSGTRLWQQRISQPLRATAPGQIYTAVDTDGQGVVHVAFPPNVGPNLFPLRVCRLAAADGALLGCSDAPLEGRVGALFALSEPQGLWMWANQTLASGESELRLYPLTASGIAAPIEQLRGMLLRQLGSETGRFDRSWVVAEPANFAGVFGETPRSTRVLLFQPGQLFASGFEDESP
jgi:hypothetical protein